MNVDNEAGSAVAWLLGAAFGERGRRRDESKAWDRVHPFLSFGFSSAGQSLVASVGYVAVNAALRSKMKIRHLVRSRQACEWAVDARKALVPKGRTHC